MSQHPFWDEKRPSHHLTLQCLLQQTLLWENTHCCVWGQWRSCDLLCGASVSSNDSACAHPLLIAFLPAQNTVDSQLATVKHENVSETGFPCLLSCFQRFYGGTLSVCLCIDLVIIFYCLAVWGQYSDSRSLTGLTPPQAGVGGFTGSLLSVCALLVQAKWTLHTQTI